MARSLNRAKRSGWTASAEGRAARARENLHGLSIRIAPSSEEIARQQRMLAEVKACPAFDAPGFLPEFEAQLARGEALEYKARKIRSWRVALGLAEAASPERVAIAQRLERSRKGQLARHGIDRGTYQAGLDRLNAAQASRPLKPPSPARKTEE